MNEILYILFSTTSLLSSLYTSLFSTSQLGLTIVQVLHGHVRLVVAKMDSTALEGKFSEGRDPVSFLHFGTRNA